MLTGILLAGLKQHRHQLPPDVLIHLPQKHIATFSNITDMKNNPKLSIQIHEQSSGM